MNLKNVLYCLTCLSFSVIVGAAIYEHTALWPGAFADLPRSLSVFQGPYKLNPANFWISVHPITLLLLAATLVASWRTARKKSILITVTGYAMILLTTFVYFVPELLDLTGTPFSQTVNPMLQTRANRWVILSLIRGGVLIALAMVLLLGLTKSGARRTSRTTVNTGVGDADSKVRPELSGNSIV